MKTSPMKNKFDQSIERQGNYFRQAYPQKERTLILIQSQRSFFLRACEKFSVNPEKCGIIEKEHRKEEKNGKTKEITVDE